MTHDKIHKEIEDNEVIERYVLNRLSPDERHAFQEHFFECEQCFEQAQASARFIAGVRAASKAGVLTSEPRASRKAFSFLLGPALAFSLATSLLLAIALAWLWFSQVPDLREEIARQRQEQEFLEEATQANREDAGKRIEEMRRQLESERAERVRLEEERRESAGRGTTPGASPQANTPIVTLESTRDSTAAENHIAVPPDAYNVVLWIAVEPGNRFQSYTVQVETKDRRLIETITGAKPNQYGALSVGVPANRFQPGQYVVKLYGARGQQRELLAEYDLRVVRN